MTTHAPQQTEHYTLTSEATSVFELPLVYLPPRPFAYYKRFRMDIDLKGDLPAPLLPEGYCWIPWDRSLVESHACTLFESFRNEVDSVVFPSLASAYGCRFLMSQICNRTGFTPQATWMAAWEGRYCGSVQGVRDLSGLGAVQNLGVVQEHRGRGLGTALLLRTLHGFRAAGLKKAFLEVTAENEGAVQLYRRLGFIRRKTLYKLVELLPVEGAIFE